MNSLLSWHLSMNSRVYFYVLCVLVFIKHKNDNQFVYNVVMFIRVITQEIQELLDSGPATREPGSDIDNSQPGQLPDITHQVCTS